MVGRGEFAYVVAAKALSLKLLDEELYAVVVWALLIAVVVAPMAFGYVLRRKAEAERGMEGDVKWFRVKAECGHHTVCTLYLVYSVSLCFIYYVI